MVLFKENPLTFPIFAHTISLPTMKTIVEDNLPTIESKRHAFLISCPTIEKINFINSKSFFVRELRMLSHVKR